MPDGNPHAEEMHALDLARTAINQQNPDLALQHLWSTQRKVEDSPGTPIWAEHCLLLAEAYGAKGHEDAVALFEETFERLSKLPDERPDLKLRAEEHYADYLCRFPRRLSKARELYVAAKLTATQIGKEDVARVQMKIVGIDLAVDKDSGLENFQTLKRIALRRHATFQTQLAAWTHHLGRQDSASRGLRVARGRNRATEQYFEDLIDSVRNSPE